MSDSSIKPALPELPSKLLSMIVLEPFNLSPFCIDQRGVNEGFVNGSLTRTHISNSCGPYAWNAITRPEDDDDDDAPARQVWDMLRALSQVCRELRAFALPLLWTNVELSTVESLGRLRQTLRVAPYLAAFIKRFVFSWRTVGPMDPSDKYPKSAGTRLEMAFSDRKLLWMDFAQQEGCDIIEVKDLAGDDECIDGEHDDAGSSYADPSSDDLSALKLREPSPPRRYFIYGDHFVYGEHVVYYEPRTTGPDLKGVDRIIKSPSQLVDSINEIVSQLTSLETFEWITPMLGLPSAACNALAQLTTLTSLNLLFENPRGTIHAAPLWNLTSNVQHLRIDQEFGLLVPETYDEPISKFTSFELPTELPTDWQEIRALNSMVMTRTVVAAAMSGRLRRLDCPGSVQRPFFLRALLPYWVHLEPEKSYERSLGLDAAKSFRLLLSHASRWVSLLDGTSDLNNARHLTAHEETSRWLASLDAPPPRSARYLTARQVQALRIHFKEHGIPRVILEWNWEGWCEAFRRFLPWLEEDAELAQQVSDAWNKVVDRGEADKVKCRCKSCAINQYFSAQDQEEEEDEMIEERSRMYYPQLHARR